MQAINYLTYSTSDRDISLQSQEEDVASDNEAPMINYGDVLIRQIKKDEDKKLRFENATSQKRIRKIIDFGETKSIPIPRESNF